MKVVLIERTAALSSLVFITAHGGIDYHPSKVLDTKNVLVRKKRAIL